MTPIDAADAPFRLTAPIEHITKLDDGTLLAHVVVTSEAPDSQGEIVDYDAFKAAAPGLMKWAVLGEMHDPDRNDAGTILRLYFDDAARRAEADVHIVDPVAVRKVLNRVYKMVSLGGVKLATQLVSVGGRTYRKITRLVADELSLVPRGANPDALIAKQFVLAKRAQEPDMTDEMDAGMASPLGEPTAAAPEARTPEQVAIDATRAALAKRDVPQSERDEMAAEDFAGKDQSYPIRKPADVAAAAAAVGRAGPENYSPDELKARIVAIATRKGPAFVAQLPKAWRKETRKMAKAAAAAQAAAVVESPPVEQEPEPVAKADAPPPVEGGGAKPPFPGAKAPFKAKKKAARKARKMAKAEARKTRRAGVARFAKGKNKTVKALAEALEAVTCAMSEEADEGDTDAVKALQSIADAIQECMTTEAAEPDPDDDEMDAFDPDMAMAYAKARRRAASRAPRLAKRLAKTRRVAGRLRKSTRSLRKDRRELRKAAVLTSVLTKSGARNSKSDLAKIDAIHEATVELGTTSHRPESPETAPAETEHHDGPLAKAADPSSLMRLDFSSMEALASILPAEKIEAIEARLAAIDEKSRAQGEQLAKIAKTPSGGGPATPYAPVYRGLASGEVTDKASALAKAAEVIDDPRLKEQVGQAAALEMITRSRG